MQKVQILSVSSYLPEEILSSDGLFEEFKSESQYGIPTNWMSNDMGIKERRISQSTLKPSDLAVYAAEKAIKRAGIEAKDIDMVIYCGIERDRPEPATAHTIANQFNINAKHTFDVANACYGFIEGMKIGTNFIACGLVENALIVTSETLSRIIEPVIEKLKKGMSIEEAKKYIGFLSVGDAGGAVILSKSLNGTTGFETFNTITASKHVEKCHYSFSKNGEFNGVMAMGNLAALMVKNHSDLIQSTLKQIGQERFDFLLSHQIGKRPYERLSELDCIKDGELIKTYDYLGNIASATFPVSFEKLTKHDNLEAGSKVGGCFAGSGIVIGQIAYTI